MNSKLVFIPAVLAFVGVATTPTSALAKQSEQASDFSKVYRVACEQSSLRIGMQVFELDGTVIHNPTNHSLTISLPCESNPVDDAAFLEDVHAQCVEAFDPDSLCDGVTQLVGKAMQHMTERLSGTMELTVKDAGTWVNRVLGIYSARAVLTSTAGNSSTKNMLLANNDGSKNGIFGTISGSILPVPLFNLPLCAATMVQSIDGQIFRDQSYGVEARYNADASVWCPVDEDMRIGSSDQGRFARIGITGHTDFIGGPSIWVHMNNENN